MHCYNNAYINRPGLAWLLGVLLGWSPVMYTFIPLELCELTRYSLAEILVLDGTAGAGRMAPPASTRISARLKRVGNTVHP